jgi:uncharacterized glyoxalase superfamily protein PhnB
VRIQLLSQSRERRGYYRDGMKNRSVPVNTVLPHVTYKDLAMAIDWLRDTLGFVEYFRYGDPVAGALMHLGDAWVMADRARSGRTSPAEAGFGTQMLTIFVEDVEGHFARTKARGAVIFEDLHETIYGELQYGVVDLEGHRWLFSRHARDVGPEEWGAVVARR